MRHNPQESDNNILITFIMIITVNGIFVVMDNQIPVPFIMLRTKCNLHSATIDFSVHFSIG